MTFKEFMQNVDKEMNSILEVNHLCIADFRYRDYFDDGFTPRETAISALIEEYSFTSLAELCGDGEIGCTYEELIEMG